jgi:hypothetical protein
MKRILGFFITAVIVLAGSASAQTVRVTGRGDTQNDVFLRSFVERGGYLLITRDTAISARDTIRSSVLVLESTVRLDGVVTGDVVVVDGNLFLRPTARVLGNVRNVAGGYYPSDLAVVSGETRNEPNALYHVTVKDDSLYTIGGLARQSGLFLTGMKGLTPPTYDRVDGVKVTLGAGWALPAMGLIEPIISGHVDYRSQRGEITGGGELAFARNRTTLAGGWERTTLTNEQWNRDDITNSISSLIQGKDRRDYYEADIAYVEVRRLLENGARVSNAWIRGQTEDASSLVAGSPWSLRGDLGTRPNMLINEGEIRSIIGGFGTEWTALTHKLELDLLVEYGENNLDDCGVFECSRPESFTRYAGTVEWAMPALSNHTLEIEVHAQGPLPGTEALPLQRWSFVGGSGTLYTFPDASFRGDRVVMVETGYKIPLPSRFKMRFLGTPTFELLHYTGMAWTALEKPPFEQNVGVRLRYNFLYARAIANPEDFGKIKWNVGLTMPRKLLPWQEAAEK